MIRFLDQCANLKLVVLEIVKGCLCIDERPRYLDEYSDLGVLCVHSIEAMCVTPSSPAYKL